MAGHIQISRGQLSQMASHASGLRRRLESVSRKAERAFDVGINAGLTVGVATGMGFLHGRKGTIDVAGVPVELAGGLVATGCALFGVGGKHHDKLGAVGGSLLAVYAYNTAKGAGLKMKADAEAAAKKSPTTTGRLPQDALSRQEIETMDRPLDAQRAA